MDYVQNPYFTDENVEKEKGIIGQEIMMYEDYPEWIVYINSLKSLYKNNPVKLDITGSIQSIAKIDKEVLYKCYNTFYNPSNMVMCFSGDFEPEQLIEEVKKRLQDRKDQGKIKRIYEQEQEKIVNNEIEVTTEVSLPIFVIAIKDKINEQEDIVKKHIAIEIILNILIGKSSKLYKELYESELIMSEPYLEYEFAKSYAHIAVTGQSREPKKILEKLKQEIKNNIESGINEAEFVRIKNMIYGNYVKEYNNVSEICRMFVSDYFKGINSFDYIEQSGKIDIEYVNDILKNVFKKDKMVISIVKGK